ncbi:unnamed protein product [Calicophoron daubneyi]|uniref:Protein kinase domain-containing protein n=1 Tax=Calicophoron daubneyi TaxID=300641 RepID=A0AAV2T6L0_CALDB
MSSTPQKTLTVQDETATVNSESLANCDSEDGAGLNGDTVNRSALKKDACSKPPGKKVKILDLKSSTEPESDDEDSFSQLGAIERPAKVPASEAALPSTSGQPTDAQATAFSADRKKTKEERKKEREKKKEEEMLKKYQAEQEAKQKIAAKSKCGRWIKHNLKIGEGGYKFVYRGYDTAEAKNVAWCEFKREHVDTKEKRQAMFKETEIMLKMNHPHIVRCFDVFREWIDMEDPNNQIDEKGVVIIQELMGEGTLKSVIRKNFVDGQCILKFPLITRWWHQILDALRYMHHKIQPPILHRDLKADNCFLYGASDEEYLNVKVGDFGLATHVNNSGRKTMLGTLGFMAPEIFDEKYDEKVDIYAFGMLMLEVMTNRTPYDECDTVLQVAAKTMSGQGPDIMDKITNPTLREVISACIQPLSCFRPTAEELYFHPLFQRYQEADDSWPKTLPVEVEPNYDNATDRAEVLDRFIRSLENPDTRNPNFNLRLRFRDKKMLQELGLDDGESLEFDLDIYKAEDQDIPDLIHNLRLGYEDKLWRVFENPKQPDKKIVSSHLDKLFSSIRLQMQFLVKVLLGKRWKAILESMVDEHRTRKKQDSPSNLNDDDESDTDAREPSSFTIIGKYKSKWIRAKKLLEKEIQAYRNATSSVSTNGSAPPLSTSEAPSGTASAGLVKTNAAAPAETSVTAAPGSTAASSSIGTQAPAVNTTPVNSCPNSQSEHTESAANLPAGTTIATIGKFCISTPAVTGAPASSNVNTAQANGTVQASTVMPTVVHQDTPAKQPGTQHSASQPPLANGVNIAPLSQTAQHDTTPSTRPQSEANLASSLLPKSQPLSSTVSSAHLIPQAPVTLAQPYSSQPSSTGLVPPQQPSLIAVPQAVYSQSFSTPNQESDPVVAAGLDNVARSAILLQQVLQGMTSGALSASTKGYTETGTCSSMMSTAHVPVSNYPSNPMAGSLLNQAQAVQSQPSQSLPQQHQLIIAAAAAAAAEQAAAAAAVSGHAQTQTQLPSTGQSHISQVGPSVPPNTAAGYISQETMLQNHLLGPTLLPPSGSDLSQLSQQSQPQPIMHIQHLPTSTLVQPNTQQSSASAIDQQQQLSARTAGQQNAGVGSSDRAVSIDQDAPAKVDAQHAEFLNQLTEALMNVAASAGGAGHLTPVHPQVVPSAFGLSGSQQLIPPSTAQPPIVSPAGQAAPPAPQIIPSSGQVSQLPVQSASVIAPASHLGGQSNTQPSQSVSGQPSQTLPQQLSQPSLSNTIPQAHQQLFQSTSTLSPKPTVPRRFSCADAIGLPERSQPCSIPRFSRPYNHSDVDHYGSNEALVYGRQPTNLTRQLTHPCIPQSSRILSYPSVKSFPGESEAPSFIGRLSPGLNGPKERTVLRSGLPRPVHLNRIALLNKRHSAVEGIVPPHHHVRTASVVAENTPGLDPLSSVLSPFIRDLLNKNDHRYSALDQGERRPRKKSKPKPRYILRVTKLERDSDSNEPGSLRPTFYLEMPDLNNPNSELWKLSFRCNLSDTPDDIKLFQGSGYNPINEDIDRAAKEAVVHVLDALRQDVNSVKLNQDYIFYPRPLQLVGSSFQPVISMEQTTGAPGSHQNSTGALLTTKSSQSSSNAPSITSRSVGNQAGPSLIPTVPVNMIPTNQVPAANLTGTISGAPALFENSASAGNLEEVPPIDHSAPANGVTFKAVPEDASFPYGHPHMTANVPESTVGSVDTPQDDDEDFSGASRPLSPVDTPGQNLQLQTQQFIVSGSDNTGGCKSCASQYYTPNSSTGAMAYGNAQNLPCVNADVLHPDFGSGLSLGVDYVNELLSLAAKHVDQAAAAASGGVGGGPSSEMPSSLQEIQPLTPLLGSDQSASSVFHAMESQCQPEACNADQPVGMNVDTSRQLFDPQAFLLSQLNFASSGSQVKPSTSVVHPEAVSTPESLITLACTVPAHLENVFREMAYRLCSASFNPCILLPVSDQNTAVHPTPPSTVRVVEVPQSHVFLGVPDAQVPNANVHPFGLTTFKSSNEPTFIVLNEAQSDGKLVAPRVYKIPEDTAVVLTPSGEVRCLEKPALVIPVRNSDTSRPISPTASPATDTHESRVKSQLDSVQVREVPIHANVDTLTFDDVLNLLLAIRSSQFPVYRSNATSPTGEAMGPPYLQSNVHPDFQTISCANSRRSSAIGGLIHPHSTAFAPGISDAHAGVQLPGLQQIPSVGQPRSHPYATQNLQNVHSFPAGAFCYQDSQAQPGHVMGQTGSMIYSSSQQHPSYFHSNQTTINSLPSGIPGQTLNQARELSAPFGSYFPPSSAAISKLSAPAQSSAQCSQPSAPAPPDRMPSAMSLNASSPGAVNTQRLLQELLQRKEPKPTVQQPVQPLPQQLTADSSATSAASLQQLIQTLSKINLLNSSEQISNVLSQLLKVTNVPQATQTSAPPAAAAVRQPRQASPTSTAPRLSTRSQVPAQVVGSVHRISAATPPTQLPIATTACTASVTTLPALLSRLLASSAFTPDSSTNGEGVKPPTVQSSQAAAMPRAAPAQPQLQTTSVPETNSAVQSAGVGGTAPPQLATQPSLQPLSVPQKWTSQHADQAPTQLLAGQTNLYQLFPELMNALQILQKHQDVKDAPLILPAETQNLLLNALQQLSHMPSSPHPGSLGPNWISSAGSVASAQPPAVAPKVPSSSVPPGVRFPSTSVVTQPPLSSSIATPLTNSVAPLGPVHQSVSKDSAVSSAIMDQLPVHKPQTVASTITQPPTVSRPVPAPTSTTVASKFTVMPVKSENDEPAPPPSSQPAGQWNQGQNRPLRQRSHVVQTPPPPPPATPNSRMSTESPAVNIIPTSSVSSLGGSVTVITGASGAAPPNTVNSVATGVGKANYKVEDVPPERKA